MSKEKVITLYLESWQKRMLKDYVKSVGVKSLVRVPNIVKMTIDFTKPVHTNSYRVPNYVPEEDGFDIYFTDAQMASLKETTGLPAVSAMHVTKSLLENKTILIQ